MGGSKCGVKVCPFDAIAPDFSTRASDCTFCETCRGVCPAQAIQFTGRWTRIEREDAPNSHASEPTGDQSLALPRRGFLAGAAGILGGVAGGIGFTLTAKLIARNRDAVGGRAIFRPPGSVPETDFLRLCIRCGECYQACPNNVLQPLGLSRGLDNL